MDINYAGPIYFKTQIQNRVESLNNFILMQCEQNSADELFPKFTTTELLKSFKRITVRQNKTKNWTFF